MESIKLNFRYDKKEYAEAMRLHYSIILNIKRDFIIAGLLLVAGIADLLYFGYSLLWMIVVILSVLFIILLLFVFYIIPVMVFNREAKFKDDYELRFMPAGIVFKTVNIDSQIDWKTYNKVIENEKFFLLYWGKYTFTVIPKRAFINEEAIKELQVLLSEKIANYKHPDVKIPGNQEEQDGI
jgi:hypothetical protein